ncbi:MAG: L,D-transpeptidase, partial [Myxococcota bacterium]
RGARVQRSRRGGVARRPGPREAMPLAGVEGPWATLPEGGVMRARSLHLALPTEPPPEAGPQGTWIDIDVSEQTFVLYRGRTPLFATLVSTGRGGGRRATPLGTHRIWVKLAFSDMTDLQRQVERNYALERVPWVQYFEGANGLHAAFWHDEFGRRRSHGCVNLSPRDARRVFELTEPALPPGWTALFPEEGEATTVVRVRP